jgi:hypothetical protein
LQNRQTNKYLYNTNVLSDISVSGEDMFGYTAVFSAVDSTAIGDLASRGPLGGQVPLFHAPKGSETWFEAASQPKASSTL